MPCYDGRYDRELRVFTDAMKAKMMQNRRKGRWEKVDIEKALKGLREEVEELAEAVKKGNVAEIMLEGADVGTWTLIITTIAIEQALNGKKRGKRK